MNKEGEKIIKKMEENKKFLRRAIEIADNGIENDGGPFGALITKDGRIISEAYNRVVLNHDPTAHAEIIAIRQASDYLNTHDLSECTLYTSCEPCPMCLGAIYWSGIKKVIYGCDRKDAEAAGFSDKLIYDEIQLDPSARIVSFIRIGDNRGQEVFEKWIRSESKIPY
jgi:guanine deaminase